MRELSHLETDCVAGGDWWDVAEGALTGAAVGAGGVTFAAAIGFAVSTPVGLGVVATGAIVGAVVEYVNEDE